MSSIMKHLPVKSEKGSLIQGRIDKELRSLVSVRLKQNNLTWDEFLKAACLAFLEDSGKKKEVSK